MRRLISVTPKVKILLKDKKINIYFHNLGSIPICAVCDIPIIGFGTRLNEYRSGQDVDKMARTVTVVDMLVNQVRNFPVFISLK